MGAAAKATAKERQSMKASIFCGPGRTFPIEDQGDVDSAASLIGKAKNQAAVIACIKGKAMTNGWRLPDAWKDDATMGAESGPETDALALAAVTLDGSGTASGDMVIRRGMILEAGDYPDKNFTATPERLYLMAQNFAPVPNEIEHTRSILDGHLGTLRSVALSDDGGSLNGEVEIPSWLDQIMKDSPLKVSLRIDRETNSIARNGLVLDPRVTNAAMFSAYAEFASKSDLSTGIQALHDMSLGAGAKCTPSSSESLYPSSMQTFHDMAKQYGASCHANMSGDAMAAEQERALGFWEKAKAFFAEAEPPRAAQPAATPKETLRMSTTTPAAETPREKELRERLERTEGALAQMSADGIRSKAANYAEQVIAANRALPAQRPALEALFAQLLTDDAANSATVTFGAGESDKGGRVDTLIAMFKNAPPHGITHEAVPDNIILFGEPRTGGSASDKDADVQADVKASREWMEKQRKDAAR